MTKKTHCQEHNIDTAGGGSPARPACVMTGDSHKSVIYKRRTEERNPLIAEKKQSVLGTFMQKLFLPFFSLLFSFFFKGRVSLCSLGCPGIQSVDQGSLKLRDPPVFASHAGIKFKFMTKNLF